VKTSTCSTCGAPIVWVVTERGKRMPVDPDTSPRGTVFVAIEAGRPVARVMVKTDKKRPPGKPFVAHFATCGNTKPTTKPEPSPAPEPPPSLF
jgi:hypothetical protein